jgi:hypothetical protein
MIAKELVGVIILDKSVNIVLPTMGEMVGSMALCYMLLNYLKMQDGHPMIAEAHQEDISKPTHIIIPNTKEAERMVGMMSKNLPVFLHHILLEHDCTEEFMKELLKHLCKASMLAEMHNCKWDVTIRTLTTIEEEDHKKEIKAFEKAAWFKDKFGLLTKGSKPKHCLPPEALFNLDSTSVKTIHDRHQVSILNKGTTRPKDRKASEIDLTHDTNGDSASQILSSSKEDEAINNGLRSKTST